LSVVLIVEIGDYDRQLPIAHRGPIDIGPELAPVNFIRELWKRLTTSR
jgi:hypothetical protein